jgi:hypothetical protein
MRSFERTMSLQETEVSPTQMVSLRAAVELQSPARAEVALERLYPPTVRLVPPERRAGSLEIPLVRVLNAQRTSPVRTDHGDGLPTQRGEVSRH